MCKLRRGLAMALVLMLLSACALAEKSEVVYAVLDHDGDVDAAWVVNEFTAGKIVDYGDYSEVKMLNTLDEITWKGDKVSFRTTAERAAYQGTLEDPELPWLFEMTYTLDGREVSARRIAGQSGRAGVTLSIAQNPDCTGGFFATHALQITVQLDMNECAAIEAPGATQARVGDLRQLTYMVLPGTEQKLSFSWDTQDFALPAISINGVVMSIDLGESAALTQLTDGGMQLREGAEKMVQALFQQANSELQVKAADLKKLGITVPVLTEQNYAAELDKMMEAFLDGIDGYVMNQAAVTLEVTVRNAVRAEVRKQVEGAARPAVRAQVELAAREEVRRQIEAAMSDPSGAVVEEQVAAQMQSDAVKLMIDAQVALAMQSSDVQQQISGEMAAAIRPQVEAAIRQQARTEAENAARIALTAQVQLELRTQNPLRQPEEAEVAALVAERMQSAETQQGIETATEAAMNTAAMQALIDSKVQELCQEDAAYDQAYAAAEAAVRAEVTAQVEAGVRESVIAAIRLMGSGSIEAAVEQQMQSAEVQAMIDAETDKQLSSGEAAPMIDAAVEQQMQTDAVKKIISEEIAKGRYSSAYQESVAAALAANGKDGEAYQALATLRSSLDDVIAFRDGLKQYTLGVEGALGSMGGLTGGAAVTSFTDERNEGVSSVQFAITTRALEAEEEAVPVEEAEEPTVWDRLLDLFR